MLLQEMITPALLGLSTVAALWVGGDSIAADAAGAGKPEERRQAPRVPRVTARTLVDLPNGDPFRPISEAAPDAAGIQRVKYETLVFRGTFGPADDRRAILNDRFVRVGDTIGEATVRRIEDNRCVIERKGVEEVLLRPKESR